MVGLVLDCSSCQSGAFHSFRFQIRRSFSTLVCVILHPSVQSIRCAILRVLVTNVPLPFDHFFFCFLPPVAGAWNCVSSVSWRFDASAAYHDC